MCASPIVYLPDPAPAAVTTGAGQVAPVVSRRGVWAGARPAEAASPGVAGLGHAAASRVGRPPCTRVPARTLVVPWMLGVTVRVSPRARLPHILPRVVSSTRCGPLSSARYRSRRAPHLRARPRASALILASPDTASGGPPAAVARVRQGVPTRPSAG